MTINARNIAKFFIYLAPLSILIVASNMFFPFIVGKAIFFRVVITLAVISFTAHLLFWSTEEEKKDAKEIAKNPVFLSIAVFTLVFLASSIFAVNPQVAFWSNFERGEGGLQMIYYALFFMLLALVLKTKKEWTSYILYIVPIGAMVSLYAIGQRMNWLYIKNLQTIAAAAGGNIDQKLLQDNPWSSFFGAAERISGTLGNPLYVSAFIMFMLLFIAIVFLEKVKNPVGRMALGAVALFHFVVFFMSQSRNGLAGILGGAFVFLVIMTIGAKDRQIRGLISLRKLSLILLAIFVIFGSVFYISRTIAVCQSYKISNSTINKSCSALANVWTEVPIVNRFAKDRILAGLDDRMWTWGSAVSGIIERPILGWGPENFPIVFDRYYNANHYGSDSWFDRAHNALLEYLISGGVVLLVAYLSIWFFYFREIYKKRSAMPLVMLGLFVGFPVGYLIQGVSAFEVLPIYLMLYIFLAMSIRLHNQREEVNKNHDHRRYTPPRQMSIAQTGAMGALFILAVFSLYYANYLPYWKNRQLLSVAAARNSENPEVVYQSFLKTLDFVSPVGQQETVQYFLLFIYRFLDQNSANQNLAGKTAELRKLVAQADEIYRKNETSPNKAVGVKTLSYLALIHFKAASILKDNELLNSAQKLFEEGLAIAPSRFEFIYPLLDIAAIKGDQAMAVPLLARAKSLRPDLARNAQYEAIFSLASTTPGALLPKK